jgi:hypothetical protein
MIVAMSIWTWIGVALLASALLGLGVALLHIGGVLPHREPLQRDEVQRKVDRAARQQKREQR